MVGLVGEGLACKCAPKVPFGGGFPQMELLDRLQSPAPIPLQCPLGRVLVWLLICVALSRTFAETMRNDLGNKKSPCGDQNFLMALRTASDWFFARPFLTSALISLIVSVSA